MGRRTRDGLSLSQLRVLVAVAEHQNFGKASLELDLSQSAVSHAIASLETDLGIVLVSRGRYGARLTPVGERIVEQARQILRSLEVIEKEANQAKGLQSGQLIIAAFRSLATHVLPRAIAEFRHQFPGVSVVIREYRVQSEVEQALRDGKADLALCHRPLTDGFESWTLFEDEYLVFLPPHATLPGHRLTWEDLAQFPLILSPQTDSCSVVVQNHCIRCHQALHLAYEVREDSTMISMVQQGLGATILPRIAAEPIPPDVQTYSLPVPLTRTNCVVVLADEVPSHAVFAFVHTLKNLYAPQERWA